MNDKDMLDKLEKIKFHIEELADAIDFEENPLTNLIIVMDWSRADLDDVIEYFNKQAELLAHGQALNWYDFKKILEEQFDIDHQRVKTVINAFYRKGMWPGFCEEYAKENMCVEFDHMFADK